ncbi:MAG: hypothetical protein AAFY19_01425 [Pseudomonadota bacterium]
MRLSEMLFQVTNGRADQDGFKKAIEAAPNEAISLLRDHLQHREYRWHADRVPSGKDRFNYEWLINPYQFRRQAISSAQYIPFAEFLSSDPIWQKVAPHFYDSSAFTRVFMPMLYDGDEDVERMAAALNRKGQLSACLTAQGFTPSDAEREFGVSIAC